MNSNFIRTLLRRYDKKKKRYLIENRLGGTDEAPSDRAPRLRQAHVKHLAFVLHVGIVSVNPVLTRERVDDVLADERGVVGQQQTAGFRLREKFDENENSISTACTAYVARIYILRANFYRVVPCRDDSI